MPKISIVLPNYNYARYLDERIQSLLAQTYKDFELIILDDASTDNSLEVIEKYTADSRVKTKFFTENSGLPYKRWNDGADMAQGEYLLFAGADDSCHPTLLERLVEKLDNHPNVGLAFCQSWQINSEGKRLGLMKSWTNKLDKERWSQDFVDSGKNEIQYLLFQNTIPNASAVLMRRQIFIEAGKFDTQLRLSADWLLWVNMLMISDIAFVAEPLNYFRRHENTVSSKAVKGTLYVKENYHIQKYMTTHPNLIFSSPNIYKICDINADEWIHTLNMSVSNGQIIHFNDHIRIYQIASSIDSQLVQRLMRKFARRLLDSFKHKLV
jgi:glycosyltransferase involved in cell wall biosynthesis